MRSATHRAAGAGIALFTLFSASLQAALGGVYGSDVTGHLD